jgi:hypothetical protein
LCSIIRFPQRRFGLGDAWREVSFWGEPADLNLGAVL